MILADAALIVATHQSNYMQIQDLKGQVSSLERQIKEAVAGLAGVRGELLATGRQREKGSAAKIGVDDGRRDDVGHSGVRPVPLSELLGYASRISRFTVPPVKQEQMQEGHQEGNQEGSGLEKMVKKEAKNEDERGILQEIDAKRKNSSNSDLNAAAAGRTPRATPGDERGIDIGAASGGDAGVGFAALTEPERNWQLQNTASLPFVPWPDDGLIRAGGLPRVQSLLEKGERLDDLEKGGEAKGEVEGMDSHDKSDQEKDSFGKEDVGMDGVTLGVGSREPRPKQETQQGPAVFGGLDLYDPDEL